MYKSGFAKQLSICSHTHNFTLCNYARLASIFISVSWLLTIAAPGPQPHAHYSDISWDVLNKHVSLYNLIQPDDQIWLVDVIRFQNNQIWSSLRTFVDIRILHDGWSIPIWIFRWSLANWERAHQNWVEPFLVRVRVRWLLGGIVQVTNMKEQGSGWDISLPVAQPQVMVVHTQSNVLLKRVGWSRRYLLWKNNEN